jgi:hypothetical protein|tara:strand:- start:254 stop:850 length:597 start_codon:yes stop_codon:yes gene_type:complete
MTTTPANHTWVEETGAAMDAAAANPPKYQVAISKESKATILCNVEEGIKNVISALAKKEKIDGVDIDVEKFAHLPNSQTGVMMYFLAKGLQTEFEVGFSQTPVSLITRGTIGAYNKKVEGKKRLLTRDQKNEIIEKMQMSYYEKDLAAGKLTIEDAMDSIKDAFNTKKGFEEMGYMLPPAKTAYPFWETEEGEEDAKS